MYRKLREGKGEKKEKKKKKASFVDSIFIFSAYLTPK